MDTGGASQLSAGLGSSCPVGGGMEFRATRRQGRGFPPRLFTSSSSLATRFMNLCVRPQNSDNQCACSECSFLGESWKAFQDSPAMPAFLEAGNPPCKWGSGRLLETLLFLGKQRVLWCWLSPRKEKRAWKRGSWGVATK